MGPTGTTSPRTRGNAATSQTAVRDAQRREYTVILGENIRKFYF